MKLKKLIPLAGIAGVAAVAAPLVSSCSEMATEFVWKAGDNVPTVTPVQRKYKLSEDTTVDTINQATKDYLADLKNDKTLFAREIINSWLSVSTSELPFEEISITTTNVNTDDLTLSYKINIKSDLSAKTKNAKKEIVDVSVEVKNVRFMTVPGKIMAEEGTMVVPSALLLLQSEHMNNESVKRPTSWLKILRQQIANVFVDDSWFIDFNVHFESNDTTNTYHADRTNVSEVVDAIVNPSGPLTPTLTTIYWLFEGSVEINSMYLSEVEWGTK